MDRQKPVQYVFNIRIMDIPGKSQWNDRKKSEEEKRLRRQ